MGISFFLFCSVEILIVNNFSLSVGIANASGFLLSGIIAEIVFSLSINYLYIRSYRKVTEKIKDKKKFFKIVRIDKILGFIPATGEAMIFTAFILTLFITLPVAGSIKKDILSSKVGGPLVSHTQIVERQLNSIFGAAVNETLTFLTINASPSSGEKVDLKFTTSDIKIDEGAESTMLNLINSERGKMNLQHLSVSFPLRELARDYAKDMFGRGYFSHYNPEGQSPFDRMDKAGIHFQAAGENLALAPNINLAHQGLMNSPGHRANILSPDFKKVGIGVIDGGIYGEMFVQEFSN
jgi:uncharacterized protein YkwD